MMVGKFLTRALLALCLGNFVVSAAAQVVPVDINHDGKFDAFLDQAHGLLWTNGNAFSNQGLNYTSAQSAVALATFEGLAAGKWRLPTLAEFNGLYASQGHAASGSSGANWSPFSVNASWYWTSSLSGAFLDKNHLAFSPFNPVSQGQTYSDGTRVGVWAVTAVTEPETGILLLIGLAAVGTAAKRTRRHGAIL
jgi:hypothetical protein